MKKLIEEVEGEGLEALLGEYVVIWATNYIYSGKLIGVNTDTILLTDAAVVYETGELCASAFKNSQSLPNDWYVRTAAIESFGKRGF